ncbi:MAG TPA: hypothetical protein VFL86_13325 [Burkholderiaceae bacterium]|nr:hypothetical protein [Burkholderiaceae bacterium]
MHERISAADFERLANLVKGGMSAGSALKVLGRSDLPEGTVRSWLAKAGVMSSGRGGRARALSEAQIAAAAQAQQEFIRENHTSHGSVKAAYEKLGGDRLVTYSAFRQYFHESGLSPYGQTMLAQTRRAEWEAAQERRSEPPA